jgi:hypothetical protein
MLLGAFFPKTDDGTIIGATNTPAVPNTEVFTKLLLVNLFGFFMICWLRINF